MSIRSALIPFVPVVCDETIGSFVDPTICPPRVAWYNGERVKTAPLRANTSLVLPDLGVIMRNLGSMVVFRNLYLMVVRRHTTMPEVVSIDTIDDVTGCSQTRDNVVDLKYTYVKKVMEFEVAVRITARANPQTGEFFARSMSGDRTPAYGVELVGFDLATSLEAPPVVARR